MVDKGDFEAFFCTTTGLDPFPWQSELASRDGFPDLVRVPTGLGKTAGAVVSWLWKRKTAPSTTPRRLVYCLPLRTLVEQTADAVNGWLERASARANVHLLLGGAVDKGWDEFPEREAILIGTQDMLLSRALNRGYAESRFRWPIQFGLLNTDCLWVMDEVQLMDAGLVTSVQLQAFRERFGTVLPVQSLWMSATIQQDWLDTIDSSVADLSILEPTEADLRCETARKRLFASKTLRKADRCASKDGVFEAERLLEMSNGSALTLGVFNTVARARSVYQELSKLKPSKDILLIHSRFRKPERDKAIEKLKSQPTPAGMIVVSTQVIEAGMDLSAGAMLTDAAPWASMVQRFGRVNRRGELSESNIEWIPPDQLIKGFAAPYEQIAMEDGISILEGLKTATTNSLPPVLSVLPADHVLRKRDILDLFDTTPDLAGNDIDISRFIRKSDDRSVFVFWRNVTEDNLQQQLKPAQEELCSVPITDLQGIIGKGKAKCWVWDHLDDRWERSRRLHPGMVLMLDAEEGGYSSETGWTPGYRKPVPVFSSGFEKPDSTYSDFSTQIGNQTIAAHTDMVTIELESISAGLGIVLPDALREAVRWHDVGKSHPEFQMRFNEEGITASTDIGKGNWLLPLSRWERKGFRHELASGLALLANGGSDLSAYLATAHHGKVRLSIRSLPGEEPPQGSGSESIRFARGVFEGDELPSVDLGGGVRMPRTTLRLALMEIGGGGAEKSWLARTLALLREMGPFRLAFFEALTRTADIRASRIGAEDA